MENKSSSKYYLIGVVVLVVVIVIIVLLMRNSKSFEAPNKPENLVGNWISATEGKGMQGSGKLTFAGVTSQIEVSSDINLAIQKVENNIAYGTITYNNFCYTATRTTTGAQAPKCVSGISKTIQSQIAGNKLTFGSETIFGVNVSFTASYTKNNISGTFSRANSNENISGTFNLMRSKN